ncbi:MBL fold metallo-hydrolase [Saccharibacter sp. 17.LH.SD]|uniref:bifunctional sulfur transferase/dioxygenase Blh n=1 Tax=Saccharibacter sp. 17.LH.SD TaxID=2689393 RepID=UPI00136A2D2A|nr:bifunctional sulfur transferase/dioxygenase Blh [Saccharibacter sp. 17.LH.SD]MXV43527.1 MBL fold metallo-hydrolase [Saccharibacter sp. 17.LH.SD]
MRYVRINDHLIVADQPDLKTLASLKEEGFNQVVNLRPDGENTSYPSHEQAAHTVAEMGLRYHYIPVTINTLTRADIRAFQAVLHEKNGPVFAHCASGKRVMTLYVLGQILDGHMHADDILPFGRNYGFDLTEAVKWLEKEQERKLHVEGFFDKSTWSVQYILIDPKTKHCAIIDPVWDYDEKSGTTSTENADKLLRYIHDNKLHLEWILDTHPHADHFSAAHYLHEKTGAPTAIGVHVRDVQKLWKKLYNLPNLKTDGSQWNHLFKEGDHFTIGSLKGRVLFSPGHTLASVSYLVDDAVFVHDTIFMPDSGTARADFPGGDAKTLWRSIKEILALPKETRLFTGHDYQPHGRHPRWESTVGEQLRTNPHLKDMTKAAYVKLRQARDKTLPMPKLILHALQVNIQGGRLPEPEDNGVSYLKIPLNTLRGTTE